MVFHFSIHESQKNIGFSTNALKQEYSTEIVYGGNRDVGMIKIFWTNT